MEQSRQLKTKIIFAGAFEGQGTTRMHEHPDSWEIIYAVDGQLAQFAEDRLTDMQPGMFALHPPGLPHCDVAESEFFIYHVQFSCELEPRWPRVGTDDEIHSIGTTVTAIVDEWYNAEPDRGEMLTLLAARMNLLLQRCAWHQQANGAQAVVARAESIIRKRFTGEIRVEEIADAVGVSRTTLFNSFKEVRDCTPLEVLNRMRVNHAVFLLRHTRFSVAQIAQAVGFCSSSHLDRRLKDATGLNPRTIRQRRAERAGKSVAEFSHRSGYKP